MVHPVTTIQGLAPIDGLGTTVAAWVHAATRPDVVKNALSGTWLGHQLHPMLTDLPIGAWVMASVLDWTAGGRGETAARRLVGLGVVAAVPTAAAGASDWSDTYGSELRVGLVHGMANATAVMLAATSWVARGRGRHGLGRALSTAGLGVTVASGYLGGHLSYVRGVGVNNTAFQAPVSSWSDVAAVSDLGSGKPLRAMAAGVPVVLVEHRGTIRALSATCTHSSGPLDEGAVVDGCIKCPWHGSTFRLADGKVVRGPASVGQPSWEVRTDHGRVLVRSRGEG